MSVPPALDPADWRTWPRMGDRLIPPPGSTAAERVAACCAFSAARFGFGDDRPARRGILRVLRRSGGVIQQIRFVARGRDREVAVRVYGGCRAD